MSVVYFTDQELSCIYGNMAGIITRVDFCMDISDEKLMQFMVRVGICNRFAYEYNYCEDESPEIVLKIPNIEVSEHSKISIKKLIERLGLLEYNCVTNSGRCFLDSKDKQLLEELTHSLRLRYIDVLEKNLQH